MRFPVAAPNTPPRYDTLIAGRCWVIDGDTIVIDGRHIRLAGIDAPELDHPWGQQSKWAMVKLCKGQRVTARLKPEYSYDRLVAECFLPDGRDLAAELVKLGLALDWPKFSGGKYRSLEPADARKKLWRANLRQGGLMLRTDDVPPVTLRPMPPVPVSRDEAQRPMPHSATVVKPAPAPALVVAPAQPTVTLPVWPRPTPQPAAARARAPGRSYALAWWVGGALLGLLALHQSIFGNMDRPTPSATIKVAPASTLPAASTGASFVVSANILNVRQGPNSNATVLAKISQGTMVRADFIAHPWYRIKLPDGRVGWVHRDHLDPAPNGVLP